MLVVSRKADESILIKLADGADGTRTLNDLFANGPIEITLLGGNGKRVKMGIAAPPELCIRRKDREGSAAE
jgi:sRNA-binding carbon storage regulator CsrA